jgi:hypothetical protein
VERRLQGLGIERRHRQRTDAEQLADVGDDLGQERPGHRRRDADPRDQAPQDRAPDLVRAVGVVGRLAERDRAAADQGVGREVVEEARLAAAGAPDDGQGGAPTGAQLVDGGGQGRAVGDPADQRGPAQGRAHGLVLVNRAADAEPRQDAQGLGRARRSVAGIDREQAIDQLGHRARGVDAELAGRQGQARRSQRDAAALVGARQGVPLGQEFEGDDPGAPQVGGRGRRRAAQDLGRDVAQGAGRAMIVSALEGQAEVEDPDSPVGDQDVGRLEVAVADAAAMQVVQGAQELSQELELGGDRAAARGAGDRGRTFDHLEHQVRLVAIEAVVEHRDDVGMAQRGQDAELVGDGEAAEAVEGPGRAGRAGRPRPALGRPPGVAGPVVAGQRAQVADGGAGELDPGLGVGHPRGDRQAFDRDRLAGQAIAGPVDRAHPALAELVRERVAPGDHRRDGVVHGRQPPG